MPPKFFSSSGARSADTAVMLVEKSQRPANLKGPEHREKR
jgi:hypothetical protein